jgi:elongation factor P
MGFAILAWLLADGRLIQHIAELREKKMPQINTGDFKKGIKVILDGDPFEMLECNFVKPGKGQALYKTRLRNLLKGTILDRTYKSGDSLEAADVRRGEGQYMYRDPNSYYFMDNESFEQYTLPAEVCEDTCKFLLEGATCGLLFWNDKLIDVTPPAHVVVEVTYTEPAARGNTATNVSKPATVQTGAVVLVPAFIETGEKIKVDARTGEYLERARS